MSQKSLSAGSLAAVAADLASLAFVLDGRFAESPSQIGVGTRIGLQPRYAGELLEIYGIAGHFHKSVISRDPR